MEISDIWRLDNFFGSRARAARERLGLTQAEVAHRLGNFGITLHASAVAKIEAGDRPAKLREAVALAQILEQPLQSLASDPAVDVMAAAQLLQSALRSFEAAEEEAQAALGSLDASIASGGDLAASWVRHPSRGIGGLMEALSRYSPAVRSRLEGSADGE